MAASAVYLPLDVAKMPALSLQGEGAPYQPSPTRLRGDGPMMIWMITGYRSRSDQPRPSAQKETDELTKQVLEGKIYAAEQSTPGSVSRSHLR